MYKKIVQYWELIFEHEKFNHEPTVVADAYDKICMTNEKDKKFFEERGFKDSSKIVTGHVDTSRMLNEAREKNISYDPKYVLFISQPVKESKQEQYISIVKRLCDYFTRKDKNFLLRPHPRDSEKVISILNSRGVPISKRNLSRDIMEAKIAIGLRSTLLVIASGAGIPVIALDISGENIPNTIKNRANVSVLSQRNIKKQMMKDTLYTNVKSENSVQSLEDLPDPAKQIAREIIRIGRT